MDWFVELFRYATSGFWVFIGCAILLALFGNIAGQITIGLIRALRNK